MKRKKTAEIKKVPWKRGKDESKIAAFVRQAPPVVLADQRRLVKQGWKPLEAALEAWLTMEAGKPGE